MEFIVDLMVILALLMFEAKSLLVCIFPRSSLKYHQLLNYAVLLSLKDFDQHHWLTSTEPFKVTLSRQIKIKSVGAAIVMLD